MSEVNGERGKGWNLGGRGVMFRRVMMRCREGEDMTFRRRLELGLGFKMRFAAPHETETARESRNKDQDSLTAV